MVSLILVPVHQDPYADGAESADDETGKTFFETMAGALSPGWTVKLQSHLQPGQMDLGRYQARLYLVDSSNGWTAAAASHFVSS